jgi:hypothetical protein
MDKCVIDTSTSDLILMIGGQILLLATILFVLYFGKIPMTFPLAPFAHLAANSSITNSVNGKSSNAKNS